MRQGKENGVAWQAAWQILRNHRVAVLGVLFALLAMVVPLAGWVGVRLYMPEIEREVFANLQAIAKLKAGQIENWLKER